jgi:choline transport protein
MGTESASASGTDNDMKGNIDPSITRQQTESDGMVLEARELKSRFSVLSAIGIQYSISATPLAVGSYITFVLGAGRSPFFFYAFCVAAAGQLLVCTSMAEIASVFPHASGKICIHPE